MCSKIKRKKSCFKLPQVEELKLHWIWYSWWILNWQLLVSVGWELHCRGRDSCPQSTAVYPPSSTLAILDPETKYEKFNMHQWFNILLYSPSRKIKIAVIHKNDWLFMQVSFFLRFYFTQIFKFSGLFK